MSDNEFTEDAILNGRVILRQPKRGYRINLDTVLLAAAVTSPTPGGKGRFIELGCGVGGALLCVAKRFGGFHPFGAFVGIERDAATAELARENAARNELTSQVRIVEVDALTPPDHIGVFDRVFFNPPFDCDGDGRAPSPERRAAYITEYPLGDWIKVWSNHMASGAELTLIQRANRLPEILAALEGRLGGLVVFPIRPHAERPARRVIVRATKGSRGALSLLSGLDLHPDDASKGKYTPEVEAILRGERSLWHA